MFAGCPVTKASSHSIGTQSQWTDAGKPHWNCFCKYRQGVNYSYRHPRYTHLSSLTLELYGLTVYACLYMNALCIAVNIHILLYACSFLSKPVTNLTSFARPRPSLSSLRRSQSSRTISQNWTTPAPWCRNWLRSTSPLLNPTTSQEGYPAQR